MARILALAGSARTGSFNKKLARYAADKAKEAGAEVTLISGPSSLSPPADMAFVGVQTTAEMLAACQRHLDGCAAVIMAAAPADQRPASFSPAKVKKSNSPGAIQVQVTVYVQFVLE